jgi:hypothetical protein
MRWSRIEKSLTGEEKSILLVYLEYTASYQRAADLCTSMLARHGMTGKMNHSTVKRWIQTYRPDLYEIIEEKRKIDRLQRKLEKHSNSDPKLRDYISYVNRGGST